ncbi:aarF domain-containing protein kinase 1 isoform X2 [Pseudoliparis swirei]|uniref:aarF domain-containing protein kinase 1 isoform X2 n=1 Tax=Pseudoliparis swirei TaxID=2059687 RepID=UPI0024BD8D62|nr:aarF domain-containing protein kinase 1 isoform X2 [Pseudoliparis swirei]
MAGNLLKVSSLAAAVFASSGFYLYNRPLNLNDLSVIRFGRAAATTVVISLDYLTAFKHVEHDTEEYWALRSKYSGVKGPFVFPDVLYSPVLMWQIKRQKNERK